MSQERTSLGRTLPPSLLSLLTLLGALGGCAPWTQPAMVAPPPRQTTGCTVAPAGSPPVGDLRQAIHRVATATSPAHGEDGSASVVAAAGDAPTLADPGRDCPVEGARVLLIGDSLSVGLGPVMAQQARACGTSFHHHGVVGAHVTQWAEDSWLLPQLERAQPSLVVVSLGGNDFHRNDPAAVEAAIERFVDKVRARGAKLLWIAPPTMPFEDAIGARAMWQQALGGEMERDWFPTETLEIPRVRDRVHPTIAGYHDLGRRLWSWIAATG